MPSDFLVVQVKTLRRDSVMQSREKGHYVPFELGIINKIV